MCSHVEDWMPCIYMLQTQNPFIHSLLVHWPQSLKLLESGSGNSWSGRTKDSSATGKNVPILYSWVKMLSPSILSEIQKWCFLKFVVKEVSDTLIFLGATFMVRGLMEWSAGAQGRFKSLLAQSPGTCFLSLKAYMPPIWIAPVLVWNWASYELSYRS